MIKGIAILAIICVIYTAAEAIYDSWWRTEACTDRSDHMGLSKSNPRTLTEFIIKKLGIGKNNR